jgi:dihydrofolate synthase/folylpolyglutamate synthase
LNYPDSVAFLYALGNEIKTAKFGLDRIRRVLQALGNPHAGGRFIHVAGTNGKGSTCAMIEAGLRAAGQRTGLFTSPHLQDPAERIRIGGGQISHDVFAEAFRRVHATAEQLLDAGEIDLHPTYFETVTAMAFVVFAEERVDRAVIEVGLGGRLDATNVIQPEICAITPIDFDHEAYLGKSLESIAGEKAGILKPGVAAVVARQRPEAAMVVANRAAEIGVPLFGPAAADKVELHVDGSRFAVDGIPFECRLAGEHQVENALTAIAVLDRLGVDRDAMQRGIAGARWPGRLELFPGRPEILLDGAHNPAGARALAGHLRRFYAGRRITLIYGAMRDKAVHEMAGILFPLADHAIVTAPRQMRAVQPASVREAIDHPSLELAPDIRAALEMAGTADLVVVTGSLFLVAEARELLSF